MTDHILSPNNTGQPEHFALLPDRADFRPVGKVSLPHAVGLITGAILYARSKKAKKLLVDITGLTGFAPPSISDRYFMIREWADAALGELRLVIVAPEHIIDPQKFGVTVATNAGMPANIFPSETEALQWLMGK